MAPPDHEDKGGKEGPRTEGPEAPDVADRPSRALPPPIPRASATRRGLAVSPAPEKKLEAEPSSFRRRLESPSALERALRERTQVDPTAQVAALQSAIDAAATSDPTRAALHAYELGQLCENDLHDEKRALDAYRRAAELDSTLRCATWSLRRLLYRHRAFPEIAKVIDLELATSDGVERLDLLMERAAVVEGGDREALEKVIDVAPGNQVALLQLERALAAKSGELPAVWRQLVESVKHPERKLGYTLDLAWATRADFDAAARIAGERAADRVVRQRLRCVAAGGNATELEEAFDAYERVVVDKLGQRSPNSAALERELVAVCWLRARHVRTARPQDAWIAVHQASTVSHADPLLTVEMIELAGPTKKEAELPALVQLWKSTEDAEARQVLVSRWSALAFRDRERRAEWRALVGATHAAVPGWIIGVTVAECETLAAPRDATTRDVLAAQYLAVARAAARGTWLGAERGQADPVAAAMLYIQAAEVFAHYLDDPDVESAHSALDEARELLPDHPAVIEATIELEDTTGEPQEAIDRLRRIATPDDPAPLVRALRMARTHGLTKVVFELEGMLLDRAFDLRLAWEHETTLVQLGRDDERAELLVQLARNETDHQRKYIALLGAARLYGRLGAPDTAISLLRELRAIEPDQQFPREALIDALRRAQMWPALVVERMTELDTPRSSAALREIAWVQEICLADPAAAARTYAIWVERVPTDHTALEGLARCSMSIGDTAAAVRAHEALAADAQTETARWLLARSLSRAGLVERAIDAYRELLTDGREHVALTAALTLVELATRQNDAELRAFGTSELAARTSDSTLAGALYEEVGWFYALVTDEIEQAATAFAEAVNRDPERTGALVGCTLVAMARSDGSELARRYVELAEVVGGELAVALKLRASAVAFTEGNGTFALDQMTSARTIAPDNEQAKFVMVEIDLDLELTQKSDPFSVTDRMMERGNLIATRAQLVEDPHTRAAFELDRADLLEGGGLLYDAGVITTAVVRAFPEDRRALLALRRLARDGDPVTFARASYALARLARDPAWKISLFGEAGAVFAERGLDHRDHAIAAFDAICTLDPGAPGVVSLVALLREKEDARGEISVITRRLAHAARASSPDGPQLIALLLERVDLLRGRDMPRAIEDLDALLACAPRHPAALRIRRALVGTDDTDTQPKRVALGQIHDDDTDLVGARRPDAPRKREQTPVAETVAPAPADESSSEASVTDYTFVDPLDPFAIATVLRDVTSLEDAELEVAKSGYEGLSDVAGLARLALLPLAGTDAPLGRDPMLDAWDIVWSATENPLFSEGSDVVVVPIDQLPSVEVVRRENEKLVEAFTREADLSSVPADRAALFTEIGRLLEGFGDWEPAKAAYHSALTADPRAPRALRGARRLAYRERDMTDVLALLAREVDIAKGNERRCLQRLRVDLLIASREYAAAREAITDLMKQDPSDSGLLFASLSTAYVTEEASVVEAARMALFTQVPELESNAAIGTQWRTVWDQWTRKDTADAVAAALDLALHVEGEDPTLTTALAMFAQMHATRPGTLDPTLHEAALEAAKLSVRIAPREPLVVRLSAETALLAEEPSTASHAFAQWARAKTDPAERAYAAARAAELEPTRLGRMWSVVVEQYPDDDYAVFKLRAHHVAAGKLEDAIAVELRAAREGGRLSSMIDAAESMAEETRVDEAVATLAEARQRWPESLAAVEAQADALASVGRWAERATVLDEATSPHGPSVGARDVLRLRAAASWNLSSAEESGARLDRVAISALLACERVLTDNPASVFAHATALKLARSVHDRRALAGVLARLAQVVPSVWEKSSLGLRRMRVVAFTDPDDAREIARTELSIDDPRRSVGLALGLDKSSAKDVSVALEARADLCEAAGQTTEAATLYMRAAHVAAEAADVDRALALCARFAGTFPLVAADLESALGRPRTVTENIGYTRLMLDADDASRRGDVDAAFAAFRRALALRPGDAVALLGQAFAGARLGKAVQAAQGELEVAIAQQNPAAELAAYEHLARAATVAGDRPAVIDAVRNAVRVDPTRADLYGWLERELTAVEDHAAVVALRRDVAARTSKWAPADRVAMLVDTALLSLRAGTEEDVVRACQAVLVLEPQQPLALRHVEDSLLRAGPSAELADIYERIATIGARQHQTSSAVALARAGQIYAALGKHEAAAAAYARAAVAEPRSLATLESWRASALDGARWPDLLEIARHRDAAGATSAADFHLAGVALMEGSRETADQAVAALRRVIELAPGHLDAFWRLWIIFDALGRHDELVELARARVVNATEREEKIDLHRELAERLFVADPTAALQHYRSIVAIDPSDIRAHAAIADLASTHAPWAAAADAVAARIPHEHEPRILHSLFKRLGALYAEHDDAKALDAYQRATQHAASDAATLEQVARIAVRLGAWPVALAASERLVVAEKDPAKLAEHFVRSATVFAKGFSNIERATRMLLLALEAAPTSIDALNALVELLSQQNPTALQAALEQVVARARLRIDEAPTDGAAYRMLSRASAARAALGERAALVTARAAAEMAVLFGATEGIDPALLALPPMTGASRFAQPANQSVLVPDSVPAALVAMFRAAAPSIKHVAGIELAAFGVQSKQRLRADDPLAVTVRAIATALGTGDIDVYLAPHPHLTIAEPGDPVFLVIGNAIATSQARTAYAAGAALGLVQMSLAIPARSNASMLQALIIALLDVVGVSVGARTPESEALTSRIRKHISASARSELERHARSLQIHEFPTLVRDLQTIGLRAGFVVSGQVRAGLEHLAGVLGTDVTRVVSETLARDLVGFALSDKAATLLTTG